MNEHDLDPELHDAHLSALYRQLPPEEPDADIDAAIRAAARRAVGAGPGNRAATTTFTRRHAGWFATAAMVLICFGLVSQMEQNPLNWSPESAPSASAPKNPQASDLASAPPAPNVVAAEPAPMAVPQEGDRRNALDETKRTQLARNDATKESIERTADMDRRMAAEQSSKAPAEASVSAGAPVAMPAPPAVPPSESVSGDAIAAESQPADQAEGRVAAGATMPEKKQENERSNALPTPAKPATAATDKTAMIEEIEKILARANSEIEQEHWPEANTLLKQGLDTLGERHVRADVIDDSGMKLIAADDLEKKGQLENAARLRLKILEERLRQFRDKP
ncbi:MAG: hypothetical protein LBE24_06625 [Methylobacillus sp.]|jgi:hypothetical protein|nr:hypothetical protein [Methylobacillus sp.]